MKKAPCPENAGFGAFFLLQCVQHHVECWQEFPMSQWLECKLQYPFSTVGTDLLLLPSMQRKEASEIQILQLLPFLETMGFGARFVTVVPSFL